MSARGRNACVWAALAALVTALALWVANPARTEQDLVQDRSTRSTASASSDAPLSQSFEPSQNGLCGIDLQVDASSVTVATQLTVALRRLYDDASAPLQFSLPLEPGQQVLRLRFQPQPDSGGEAYRLTVACAEPCQASLLSSAGDALAGGTLTESEIAVDSDLALTTYSQVTLRDVVGEIPGLFGRWASGLGAALLMLGGPGLLGLVLYARRRTLMPTSALGLALAFGLAFWPLTLLWMSTVGLAMTPAVAWGMAAATTLGALVLLWRRRRRGGPRLISAWDAPQITVVAVTSVAVLARLIQARDLIVPAWVDSVHHTMLTALIVATGKVPIDGAPYLQVTGLHYHYGFHACAAALSWLSGAAPSESVLLFGQLLSGLAGLPLFGLLCVLAGGRLRPSPAIRWGGALAACVPAYLTYMPAYYVSWGRYTQLMGLVLLAPILMLTWRALEKRAGRADAMALGLLVGGLAVTHYRVLFYYVLLWPILLVATALARWRARASGAPSSFLRVMAIVGAISLATCAPWAIHVVRSALVPFGNIYGSWAAPEGVATGVPGALLQAGHTEAVLAVAALGLVLATLARRWRVVLVAIWAAACLLASDPELLGVPGSWFIHGTSAVISYWLVAGVTIGCVPAVILSWALQRARPLGRRRAFILLEAVLSCAMVAGATWACWGQAEIANSRTVLVHESDLPALEWAREHLGPESLVLVNTEPWQGDIRMGSDAGWWLPYLAGVPVTYPSVLYTEGSPEYRRRIEGLAALVQSTDDYGAQEFIAALRQAGVTHLFVGSRGGPLQPEKLQDPHYVEIFRYGPTRIYQLRPEIP